MRAIAGRERRAGYQQGGAHFHNCSTWNITIAKCFVAPLDVVGYSSFGWILRRQPWDGLLP